MKSYVCKSCGSNILLNDDSSFTTCLYCGNSIAVSNQAINDLNIKKIIPFEIDKEEAIKNFNKIKNCKVIFAKKIYIPVRFCNYDFDYLINYKYVVKDDNGYSYYDAEELIDGTVENEIIFGNSRVNYICFPQELRFKKRLNYDPIMLKDVSIENTVFSKEDDILNKIKTDVSNYSRSKIKGEISRINSVKYFTSNLNIDDYSTLIPIYIMKTTTGMIYNIPGVKLTSELKYKRKKKIISTICLFLILITGLLIFFKSNFNDPGLDTIPIKLILTFMFLIPSLIIFFVWYNKKKNIFIKSYDNFNNKKYKFNK